MFFKNAVCLLIIAGSAVVSAHENCLASAVYHDMGLAKRDGLPYSYTGKNNPESWKLKDAICGSGQIQSPINFADGSLITRTDKPQVNWHVDSTYRNLTFLNKGNTVEVEFKEVEDKPTLHFDVTNPDDTYELLQFHFHDPSEHTVRGHGYPLEGHFVFKSPKSSKLAVVGVFFRVSSNPSTDIVAQIAKFLPPKDVAGEETPIPKLSFAKFAGELRYQKFFRYTGSLTTPPCTEGVEFSIARKPLNIKAEDLQRFWDVMPKNARYTQPNNGRGNDVVSD